MLQVFLLYSIAHFVNRSHKALKLLDELDGGTGKAVALKGILDKMDIERPSQEQVGQHNKQ